MPFAGEQRKECADRLRDGESPRDLAKEYGVHNTAVYQLRQQINNEDPDLVQPSTARIASIKKNLLDLLLGKLQEFYEALTPEKIEKSSAAQIAMMYGIFYDKYRLEAGKSTNNHAYSLQAVVEMSISPGGAAAIAAPEQSPAIETKTPAAAQDTLLSRDSKRPDTPDGAVTIGAAAAEIVDAETVETHETAGLPETEHPGAAVIPLFPGIRRSEAVAVSSETAAAGGAVVSEDLL